MPDCTGHRRDGIKKNRTYISNFKTVAKQLSNSRELYLRRGIFLCYNQVPDFMWGGNRTDRAFIGTAKPEVEVGQAVELFVNPDRIEEFYCPTEKASCIQKVFIGVGAVCLCLAVIMVGILWFVSGSLVCIILQTSVGKNVMEYNHIEWTEFTVK